MPQDPLWPPAPAPALAPVQAHCLPRNIPWGRESVAYWAMTQPEKAVIFVHGFGGSPTPTWDEFPTLLPSKGTCKNCDLIFFGYDSLHKRAAFSAAKLYDLLDALATDPARVVNPTLNTHRTSYQYSSIVLVAHSLGAVVSRLALVNACKDSKSWISKIKLVLFAPAHMGADVLGLLKETVFAYLPLKLLAGFVQYRYQSLRDLSPESKTLSKLIDDSTEFLNQNCSSLKAARVIFGDSDRIVDPTPFGNDPPPVVIPDVGHTGICKPSKDFERPLAEILRLL